MESPGFAFTLFGLLAVVALVLINAYFVATEFALVASRRSQIRIWAEERRRGAASAALAKENLDDAIAACQLGITLASLALGWIGEPALAELIGGAFALAGFESTVASHSVAVVIAFALITFLHVVLGELAPKAVALDRPGEVALLVARPLLIFARIFRPILVAMNNSGLALVRAFGVDPGEGAHNIHSAEELKMLVSEASDVGEIGKYTGQILGNVFGIRRTRVRDVMVPRDKVMAIEKKTDPDALLDRLREDGFTRLPVYDRDLDHIVGIAHTKDLFHLYAKYGAVILADAIRPAVSIHPDTLVIDALRQFRRGRKHLAVVRGDDGKLDGIVTLEDVLEELVGEIEDEFDEPTPAGSA